MDNKDWLIIKTLGKEKKLTTSAKKLYMTQSALTYRLKGIEKELDTKLFIRTRDGIILNNNGEILLKYVQKMLKHYDNFKEEISAVNTDMHGTLRLAVTSAYTKYNLPTILNNFKKKYPNVLLNVKQVVSADAITLLANDDVQVAIVRGNHQWAEEKKLLEQEPLVLVSNSPAQINTLPKLPYISYTTDKDLEREITAWWQERFSEPPMVSMTINDSDSCRRMVMQGLGYSILPSIGLMRKEYPELYLLPLTYKDGRVLMRPTWLMYKKSSLAIQSVSKFIDEVVRLSENNLTDIETVLSLK